jgi:cbb3-type cytochrome oxidase subunit 3
MARVATMFISFICYIGWWYQRLIRRRFTDAVKEMAIPDHIEGIPVR